MVPADKFLGEASCPVVLTAMRRETGESTCLKTPHHKDFYKDANMIAVEAAMATAAAPVAFPCVRTEKHGDLLDGGLWGNSPVLVGIIESLRFFGQSPSSVRVLHVGTTRSQLPPRRALHFGGALEYGGFLSSRLQSLLWSGQRELAMRAAGLMLAPSGSVMTVDHVFPGRGYSLMDASGNAMRQLEQAGRSEAQRASREACDLFCVGHAPRQKWNWTRPSKTTTQPDRVSPKATR
jgi:hypothetical protein